jgi:hypothetical protein
MILAPDCWTATTPVPHSADGSILPMAPPTRLSGNQRSPSGPTVSGFSKPGDNVKANAAEAPEGVIRTI